MYFMYNATLSLNYRYLRPCDRQSRHCSQMVYLDRRRFTVNHVLVLPHCNHNSVNAWESGSIFFRTFFFLKLASYLPYVRNLCPLAKSNYTLGDPKTLKKNYLPGVINPFDSSKKGVFVERDFWSSHAFLVENIYIGKVFEHTNNQNGGNKILPSDVTNNSTNQKRAYTLISGG